MANIFTQIDVSVNAPEAGTIKEFLANEDDTVVVGQDLVRMELGSAPEGGKEEKASSEPKESSPKEQSTSSDPEPKKDESKQNSPPAEESKSAPKKETPPPQPKQEQKPQKTESKSTSSSSPLGNREERRVRPHFLQVSRNQISHFINPKIFRDIVKILISIVGIRLKYEFKTNTVLGKNEPYAPQNR